MSDVKLVIKSKNRTEIKSQIFNENIGTQFRINKYAKKELNKRTMKLEEKQSTVKRFHVLEADLKKKKIANKKDK